MFNIELSKIHKGILLLVGGILLFLYSTGLIERGIDYIMIIGSLIMILYGLILVDGYKALRMLLGGKKKNGPQKPAQPQQDQDQNRKNN